MDYKIRKKIAKDKSTTSVGNGLYNIGSSSTDRFNEIWAVTFRGDSTGSFYGDIAERYTCDPDISLPIGTLMEVSDDEFDSRICDDTLSNYVIGVISENPGYEMNLKLENAAVIGLTGTLPIRVIGPVNKKDILISAGNGCAKVSEDEFEKTFKVAISFETNNDPGEKLVKCFIK